MKVIYSSEATVEMWSVITYRVEVITYITKHSFFIFHWYRIHQNNPKIKSCCYDGEYASNSRLRCIRNYERQKARLWLSEHK